MATKRQKNFMDQVAKAARTARIPRRRGKPVISNLTEEGRLEGLVAARSAPRCQATRRNGQRCRAPAMRGATKCLKHGGRVQVPEHPYNIRRFLNGNIRQSNGQNENARNGKSIWEAMSYRQRQAFVTGLPTHITDNEHTLFEAVFLFREAEEGRIPLAQYHRRWSEILGANRGGEAVTRV